MMSEAVENLENKNDDFYVNTLSEELLKVKKILKKEESFLFQTLKKN